MTERTRAPFSHSDDFIGPFLGGVCGEVHSNSTTRPASADGGGKEWKKRV